MKMIIEMVAALVMLASCTTVPVDPVAESFTVEVTIPATTTDTNTGEVRPINEDVVRVDLVEEAETAPDVWALTGRSWTVEVDDPVADQVVPFETSPLEWPVNTPLRWLGRVIDGWRDSVTDEFRLVIQRTEADYPMSEPSIAYQVKTTKVGVTVAPVAGE